MELLVKFYTEVEGNSLKYNDQLSPECFSGIRKIYLEYNNQTSAIEFVTYYFSQRTPLQGTIDISETICYRAIQ